MTCDQNAHNLSHIFLSFLQWTTLYLVIYSRPTSQRIIDSGHPSPRFKRQELAVKITSIVHAVIVTWYANEALREMGPNLSLYVFSTEGQRLANISTGFFVADLILCLVLLDEYGLEFLIHAVAALGGSVFVSMTGIGFQYFLNLLLFEGSTPFLHLRSILLEYGFGKTLIAKLNNLILLLSFAYFRLWRGIPMIFQLCYTLITDKPLSVSVTIFFICASVSMCVLNIYWFSKMARSAKKLILNPR